MSVSPSSADNIRKVAHLISLANNFAKHAGWMRHCLYLGALLGPPQSPKVRINRSLPGGVAFYKPSWNSVIALHYSYICHQSIYWFVLKNLNGRLCLSIF